MVQGRNKTSGMTWTQRGCSWGQSLLGVLIYLPVGTRTVSMM